MHTNTTEIATNRMDVNNIADGIYTQFGDTGGRVPFDTVRNNRPPASGDPKRD